MSTLTKTDLECILRALNEEERDLWVHGYDGLSDPTGSRLQKARYLSSLIGKLREMLNEHQGTVEPE